MDSFGGTSINFDMLTFQIFYIWYYYINLDKFPKDPLNLIFLLMDAALSSVVKYEMPSFNPIFKLEQWVGGQ